jgi:hypothetical protein
MKIPRWVKLLEFPDFGISAISVPGEDPPQVCGGLVGEI